LRENLIYYQVFIIHMAEVEFVKVADINHNLKATIPHRFAKELGIKKGTYLKVYIDKESKKICYEVVD